MPTSSLFPPSPPLSLYFSLFLAICLAESVKSPLLASPFVVILIAEHPSVDKIAIVIGSRRRGDRDFNHRWRWDCYLTGAPRTMSSHLQRWLRGGERNGQREEGEKEEERERGKWYLKKMKINWPKHIYLTIWLNKKKLNYSLDKIIKIGLSI